jgi:hypothetical protein
LKEAADVEMQVLPAGRFHPEPDGDLTPDARWGSGFDEEECERELAEWKEPDRRLGNIEAGKCPPERHP